MDDVTPDMDWAKFMRFKALCDLYQVQPLIGVVPDCQDAMLHIDEPEISSAAFWDYLKTLKDEGWTIAQHGVTHVYYTKKWAVSRSTGFRSLQGEATNNSTNP